MLARLVPGNEQRAAAANGRGNLKIVIRVADKERPRGLHAAFAQKLHRIVRLAVRKVVLPADDAFKVPVQLEM